MRLTYRRRKSSKFVTSLAISTLASIIFSACEVLPKTLSVTGIPDLAVFTTFETYAALTIRSASALTTWTRLFRLCTPASLATRTNLQVFLYYIPALTIFLCVRGSFLGDDIRRDNLYWRKRNPSLYGSWQRRVYCHSGAQFLNSADDFCCVYLKEILCGLIVDWRKSRQQCFKKREFK